MHVLKTDVDERVAEVTISIGDEDHKFDLWADGDTAYVEYQETLSYRGQIRVSEPDEIVYKELMLSDTVTEFLEEHDLDGVKRASVKQ